MSEGSYAINKKKVSIVMQGGKTIEGYVNIGDFERLSDMFTKDESPFLIVYDMELYSVDHKECYFVNKSQIEYAQPMDEE